MSRMSLINSNFSRSPNAGQWASRIDTSLPSAGSALPNAEAGTSRGCRFRRGRLIEAVDKASPEKPHRSGSVDLFVKEFGDGRIFEHHGDRRARLADQLNVVDEKQSRGGSQTE